MNNTWVKLYRKINLNSIMGDPVALQLFIWVLTNVDKDTGEVDFGRYYVAKQLRVNPNTLYSALKRLVSKYKVCEISSTAEYTTIKLLNWAKYQPLKEAVNTNDNNPSTTTQQPINTLQEERIENKEIKTSSARYLLDIPLEDVQAFIKKYNCTQNQLKSKAEELYNYCLSKGKQYKDYRAFLSNAVRKDFGLRVASAIVNGADYIAQKEAELRTEKLPVIDIHKLDVYQKIGKPF